MENAIHCTSTQKWLHFHQYRPIAIPPALAKLFDKLLASIITPILEPQISENQHGFVTGKSTTTNFLQTTSIAIDTLAKGKQLDVVYVDMSRAFGIVPHNILITKISMMGMSKPLLKIIWSFLTNRKQYVKIGNTTSRQIKVPSGVFQGSHCSPKFFVACINDVEKFIKYAIVIIFADDIKLMLPIGIMEDVYKAT